MKRAIISGATGLVGMAVSKYLFCLSVLAVIALLALSR